MGFNKLDSLELVNQFGELVKSERKITHQVLLFIAEIDRRKIYLERAYSSLFDFLVNEFNYSPSAAFRRIESARLLQEIPELAEKIETGALNLSKLSQVQQAIRSTQKIEHRKISVDEKRNVIAKIENITHKDTEIVLAKNWSLPVILQKEKINHDESVTMKLSLSKDQMEKLKEVRDKISHSIPNGHWAEVFVYLAEKEIKNRKSKVENIDSPKECHCRDPITLKFCGSTHALQVDHVYPKWAGGGDDTENLQILCANHNRYKYQKEVGLLPNRK